MDNKSDEADQIIKTLDLPKETDVAVRTDMKEIIDAARRKDLEDYQTKIERMLKYGFRVVSALSPVLGYILKQLCNTHL